MAATAPRRTESKKDKLPCPTLSSRFRRRSEKQHVAESVPSRRAEHRVTVMSRDRRDAPYVRTTPRARVVSDRSRETYAVEDEKDGEKEMSATDDVRSESWRRCDIYFEAVRLGSAACGTEIAASSDLFSLRFVRSGSGPSVRRPKNVPLSSTLLRAPRVVAVVGDVIALGGLALGRGATPHHRHRIVLAVWSSVSPSCPGAIEIDDVCCRTPSLEREGSSSIGVAALREARVPQFVRGRPDDSVSHAVDSFLA